MALKLTTAGESHGPRLTAILEGVPAGLRVDPAFVHGELARRQHGYGRDRRMKIERDEAIFEGGLRGGVTLGSPIAISIRNRDFANWE
ncbi:MAG: chorismate synthase, partial [Thermoanaerobaculia bacterium]